jgi:hypothetical protein
MYEHTPQSIVLRMTRMAPEIITVCCFRYIDVEHGCASAAEGEAQAHLLLPGAAAAQAQRRRESHVKHLLFVVGEEDTPVGAQVREGDAGRLGLLLGAALIKKCWFHVSIVGPPQ